MWLVLRCKPLSSSVISSALLLKMTSHVFLESVCWGLWICLITFLFLQRVPHPDFFPSTACILKAKSSLLPLSCGNTLLWCFSGPYKTSRERRNRWVNGEHVNFQPQANYRILQVAVAKISYWKLVLAVGKNLPPWETRAETETEGSVVLQGQELWSWPEARCSICLRDVWSVWHHRIPAHVCCIGAVLSGITFAAVIYKQPWC